jgi:hypothetical protein
VTTGAKSLSTLAVALALFGLAGSAVMVAVPGLFAGPVRPEFTVFLVAGVAAIVLTASFFWLGLALILLYHVMWIVFFLTLVSIWPFRTYTPK